MPRDQRQRGRRAILDAIRRSGRIARIDIAEATGISQATVTTITAELLRDGLIEEVPRDAAETDVRRGRPRVDLKLRGGAHLIAGAKIAKASVSVAIVDFEGRLLGEHATALAHPVMSPQALSGVLRTAVSEACERIGRHIGGLTALGVGIAGFVDTVAGLVHWSPSLDSRNVRLASVLRRDLGMPVFVDNDANLVAMAELYFGHGRGVADFLVVTVESGVGMGVVLGGEVYRGNRGCGAEFGHTKVQLDGALCRCGQRGCLEAYVADYALLREASVMGLPGAGGSDEDHVHGLLDAARGGDPVSRSIVDRAGRMFAMGLSNLVNIFDPQLIVLSGERMQVDHLIADDVLASIRNSVVRVDAAPPRVVIHRWGDSMWAVGAAAYALQEAVEMSLKDLAENA